jgi:hypothetical protein
MSKSNGRQFLTAKNMAVVLHTPYFPEMIPFKFVFRKITYQSGRRFQTIPKIQGQSLTILEQSVAVLHAIPKNWLRRCFRQRHYRWTHWTKPEGTTLKGTTTTTTSHKVTRVCRYGLSWTTSEQRLIRTNFTAQGVSPRVTTARHTSTNNLQDSKRARYGRTYAKIYTPKTEIMRKCFNGQNNALTTFLSIPNFVTTTDSKSIS